MPFRAPNLASPIFSHEIDGTIIILDWRTLDSQRPQALRTSTFQQSLLGFLIVAATTIFDFVLIPYIPLTVFAGGIPWYVSFAILGMAETAVAVIGVVLLTYSIQSPTGKILLWLGAIVGLAVAIAFDSQNLRLFPYYPGIIQRSILSLQAIETGLLAASFL